MIAILIWIIVNLIDNEISRAVVAEHPEAEINYIYQLTGSFEITTLFKVAGVIAIPVILWKINRFSWLWWFIGGVGIIVLWNIIVASQI